jgi:hypothetical protein
VARQAEGGVVRAAVAERAERHIVERLFLLLVSAFSRFVQYW